MRRSELFFEKHSARRLIVTSMLVGHEVVKAASMKIQSSEEAPRKTSNDVR